MISGPIICSKEYHCIWSGFTCGFVRSRKLPAVTFPSSQPLQHYGSTDLRTPQKNIFISFIKLSGSYGCIVMSTEHSCFLTPACARSADSFFPRKLFSCNDFPAKEDIVPVCCAPRQNLQNVILLFCEHM